MIKAVGLPRINIDLVYAKNRAPNSLNNGSVCKPPEPFQHYNKKAGFTLVSIIKIYYYKYK